MNPLMILGILLAVSATGNALLTHLWRGEIANAAHFEQAYDGAIGTANACTASVDKLSAEGVQRHLEIVQRLTAQAGRVKSLEQSAIGALNARPADAGDLCASVVAYLKSEIKAGKGAP